LFVVTARVKKVEDLDAVKDQILETVKGLRDKPVGAARLESVRNHLRYALALRMDNSETIASILASYVALRRTPETLNRMYGQMGQLTPQDIQRAAAQYLTDKGRTIVTLTGPQAAAGAAK
jgi:zinc protease